MKITREWAMPNKWTFKIKPIKLFLDEELAPYKGVIDPFAGMYSPAEITNDINPDCKAQYRMDALDFLNMFEPYSVDGLIYDPPYSLSMSERKYKKATSGFVSQISKWKKQARLILKPGAKAVCFGWDSMGLGTKNFELERILLVCHGATHHDTICTVERKIQHTLKEKMKK